MKRFAVGRLWLEAGLVVLLWMHCSRTQAAQPPDVVITSVSEAQEFTDSAPFVFKGQSLRVHTSFVMEGDIHLEQLAPIQVTEGARFEIQGPISSAAPRLATPLEKSGGGTLVLSGLNTYTSVTALREGTLELAGPSALGEALYSLQQHAGTSLHFTAGTQLLNTIQLQATRTGDTSLPGLDAAVEWRVDAGEATVSGHVLSDGVGIRKTGAGVLRLDNAFQGHVPVWVEEGVLSANGAIAAYLDIGRNARLEGSGSVFDLHIRPGGTVSPGGEGNAQTMTVWTGLHFDPDAIYQVDAHPEGDSDHLHTWGAAWLDGQVRVAAGAGKWGPEQGYTILTAEGGLNDTRFESVTTDLAFLDPTLSYDTRHVYLTLTRNDVNIGEVGETPDDEEVGNVIDPPKDPAPDPDPIPDPGPDPGTEPIPDPGPDPSPDPDPPSGPDPTPEPDPGRDPDILPDTDPDPTPEPDTPPGHDPGTDPPGPSETDPGTPEPDPPITPELPPDSEPDGPPPTIPDEEPTDPHVDPDSPPVSPVPEPEDRADTDTGGTTPLQDVILTMDKVQARTALRQLSGSWHASVGSFLLENGRYVREAMLHEGRRLGELNSSTASTRTRTDLRPWAHVVGASGTRRATHGVPEDRHTTRLIAMGLNVPTEGGWEGSGVLSAQQARLRRDQGSASATLDTYHAGVSLNRRWDAMGIMVGALHGWHRIESRRRVSAGPLQSMLSSSYPGRSWQVFAEILPHLRTVGEWARSWRLDASGPYLRHTWSHLKTQPFAEEGGLGAHDVASFRHSTHATTFGWRHTYASTWRGRPYRLEMDLGWQHVWRGDDVTSTQRFSASQGAPASAWFTSKGLPVLRNGLSVGLNTELQFAKHAHVGLRYSGLHGRGHRDHAGALEVRWRF